MPLGRTDSTDAAYRLCLDVFNKGGFNLHKFVMNELNLQRKIDEAEKVTSMSDVTVTESYAKMVLSKSQRMLPGE